MKKLLTAAFVASLLTASSLVPSSAHTDGNSKQKVEVAFVLDTTGSMANLIEGAKRKIWSIANTIVDVNPESEIRIALIAYRDVGDEYVLKTFPLTEDIQDMYSKLLDFRADGGGDTPEAVNEALAASVNKAGWSQDPNAHRMIFLVGDAPPHMDYNGPQYPELVRKAHEAGIIVNAVQAGRMGQTRKVWKKIATLGGGDYIPIPQSGGQVVIIDTPYDDDIHRLQMQIDKTVLPYGDRKHVMKMRKKLESLAAAPRSTSADRSSYDSKRVKAGAKISGSGDFLSDYTSKPSLLESVKEKQLPEILRGKSETERRAALKKLSAKRTKLRREMSELVSKRAAFVANKRANMKGQPKDSFDEAVARTIKKALTK